MKSIDILSIHEIIVKNYENAEDSNKTELQKVYDEVSTTCSISSEIMNDLQDKINETKRITNSENFFFILRMLFHYLKNFSL